MRIWRSYNMYNFIEIGKKVKEAINPDNLDLYKIFLISPN